MNPAELIAWMQEKLFPKWDSFTAEQLASFAMAVSGHDEDLVRQAMRLHWQDRGSFTAPVLKDLMAKVHQLEEKQAKPKADAEQAEPSRSLHEIIRWCHPAWRKLDNNYELILRYYRQLWWLRAKPRIDAIDEPKREIVRAAYEKQLKENCANALSSLGMCEQRQDGSWSYDYAKWASATILDRQDDFEIAVCQILNEAPKTTTSGFGGPMPTVEWPTPPKPAARAPLDLIKQLSIAEHSKSDAELVAENDTVPTA